MADHPSKQTFNLSPLLYLSICFASGIALGHFCAVGIWVPAVAAFTSAILSVVLRNYSIATFLVFVTFLTFGCSLTAVERNSVSADRIRQLFDDGRWISGV